MNKHNRLKTGLLIVACLIGLVFYFFFSVQKENSPELQTVKKEKADFDENCYTRLKKDTLISLLKAAHRKPAEITIKENGHTLEITLTASPDSAPAFYNGNDALLQYDLDDFGFKISKTNTGLLIRFRSEEDAVNVPNDVLIKLIPKSATEKPAAT